MFKEFSVSPGEKKPQRLLHSYFQIGKDRVVFKWVNLPISTVRSRTSEHTKANLTNVHRPVHKTWPMPANPSSNPVWPLGGVWAPTVQALDRRPDGESQIFYLGKARLSLMPVLCCFPLRKGFWEMVPKVNAFSRTQYFNLFF